MAAAPTPMIFHNIEKIHGSIPELRPRCNSLPKGILLAFFGSIYVRNLAPIWFSPVYNQAAWIWKLNFVYRDLFLQ